ncbi:MULTISPECIES: hypothetical protein [Thermaerobacter]|uniref:Rod shape-determining protein MreD n=1 Tax=Thermaerobacter composti TaxID=554949 RepID=A0ABZ0QN93_9FIRM|nr:MULTISPECIES: hypothetical protein [Thermaerobacter]PZN08204.1 MAG: hypothetical protein DIU76_03150 [Bacillota bacterium]QBS36961.1 hypothetical protein E1B22_02775 [Thermaerobacter sp. FW80]WPD18958.1 hypothetical protein Q5761_11450 [Thermaerobacter composti]
MRRPARWALLALVALWLEATGVPSLGLPRLHLPLLLGVAAGLVYGPRQGLAVGGMAGLALDLWTGRLVGSWSLLHALAGWVGGKAGESLYRDVPGLSPALGVTATWLAETVRGLLVAGATGMPVTAVDLWAWSRTLVPELIAAAVVAPLVFRFVLWLQRREREARAFETLGGWRGGWP